MELEHYPGMTETAIEAISTRPSRASTFAVRGSSIASACWQPEARSCWSPVASAHRGEAFQACEFLMDYLKTQAPFWKRNQTPRTSAGSTRGAPTTPPWRAGASRPAMRGGPPPNPMAVDRGHDVDAHLDQRARRVRRRPRRLPAAMVRRRLAEPALERVSTRDAVRELHGRPLHRHGTLLVRAHAQRIPSPARGYGRAGRVHTFSSSRPSRWSCCSGASWCWPSPTPRRTCWGRWPARRSAFGWPSSRSGAEERVLALKFGGLRLRFLRSRGNPTCDSTN